MKIRDEEGWKKCKDNNPKNEDGSESYGSVVNTYAENWADAMEKEIEGGAILADVAETTQKQLSHYGISGFQYGCVVSTLAGVWEHGEALRRWHNIDTQIGTEGARANDEGGTLNPAVLNTEL